MGVTSVVFIVLAVLVHGIRLVRPESVESAINKNLSSKSDMSDVLHFLNTHHILYLGCTTAVHTCYGKVYRSSIGLMKSDILIEFTFGEDGKLVSHRMHEGFTFAWE